MKNTEFYKLIKTILSSNSNLIGTYNSTVPAMSFDGNYAVANVKGLEVVVRPGKTLQKNFNSCHVTEKVFFVLLTQNEGINTIYEAVDRLENYYLFNRVETRYMNADPKQGDKPQAIISIYDYC